jgi:phosphate transport system protein
MDRHVHEDLRVVTSRLAAMGELVEARVRDAVIALATREPELAIQVATGDEAVNELEVEVDDLCLKVLALQNPVASDLRVIRSVIKANTDLERIGDQAVNMARAAIEVIAQQPLAAQSDVIALSEVALGMLHDSLKAFVEQDVTRAQRVLESDDRADTMRDALLNRLLAQMRNEPDTVPESQALMTIARGLERTADHATNIAEDLIFLVDGRDVRHNRGARPAAR